MGLIAQDKSVVVPGETLAEGMDYLPGYGTYRLNDKIIAQRLGLLQVDGRALKLIPLSGKYFPKRGDVIIGKVADILMSGWKIETNTAYPAVLPLKDASSGFIRKGEDLSRICDIGDYVVVQVTNVTSQNLVDVSMRGPGLRKLIGGRVITINPYKVPRVIGSKGSMISMVKEYTGCRIIVGQNGLVWISGEPEDEILAEKAIRKIEEEAHLQGLTERMNAFLEKETGGVKKGARARPEGNGDNNVQ